MTASFNGHLSAVAEYGVIAWVTPGAVNAADNPVSSTGQNVPGSAPIGGNAGAFTRGFTTGPDVFGITLDKTTGQVTVNLDQRITSANINQFTLLNNTGTPTSPSVPTFISFNSSPGPGPEAITLHYPASALTNATMVQFNLGAMTTPLTGPNCFPAVPCTITNPQDAQNIQQIVDPTNQATILKQFKTHKAAKKHAKKHAKKGHKKH